jgi:glycerophosphoryl diester phosphodiesterase
MRRVLLVSLALCLAAVPAASAQAANRWIEPKAPLNIAHQGGEDEFPANTMYAFRRAVRAGADMLELDVGVTRDGKVIVMHDTTVDGKTNGHGTVASKTLRQIKRLDAAYWFAPRAAEHYSHSLARRAYRFRGTATGRREPPSGFRASDFRVPTLAQVLKAFPRTPINIEIKGRPPDEATEEYVQNAEVLARPEGHEAARPDRRVVPAGSGGPLPRARAPDRPCPGHRWRGRLADRGRLPGSRRGGVPGADHLHHRRHATPGDHR